MIDTSISDVESENDSLSDISPSSVRKEKKEEKQEEKKDEEVKAAQ